jgi:RNA polymerase sigma-70 factor, ECF subfamily
MITDTGAPTLDGRLLVPAVRALSHEHRRVLLECYLRGASVAEAAETLGLAPSTVKSRTHYALRALRRALAVDAHALTTCKTHSASSDTPGDGPP